jgi:bla regulator protein blaR1
MISGFVAHLWQSTLFVGAAWFVTLALRKNPAWVRYLVWFITSAKFLIPFFLLVGLGAFVPRRTAVPPVETAWVAVAGQVRPLMTIPAVGAEVTLTVTGANRAYFPAAALFLWFCGFAAIAICWAARWRRIRELRSRATPVRMSKCIESAIPIMSVPGLVEPGVFGILRPILLLPEGIEARLDEAQLEAILAHEFCHVRRRDNLTATIHMAVQAAFWFHPLVWWLGARLVEERERACDEEVLRLGNRPQVYASGILNVCKLYVESPLACVSGVTGADLKKRIEAIMKNRVARRLDFTRKVALAVAGTAVLAVPVLVGVMNVPMIRAQQPAFEVASVKLNRTGSSNSRFPELRNGTLAAENVSLKSLLSVAYGLSRERITGPAWLDSDRFDLAGKAPLGVPNSEMKPMLQALLKDRFKVEVHRESRDMPVYEMVVAKGGLKISLSDPEHPLAMPPKYEGSMLKATGTMSEIADKITPLAGRPVLDKTGLQGRYAFMLIYSQLSAGAADSSSAPDFFTAVEKQMGLTLEAKKEPIDILIVDHAERVPTAN